MEVDNLFGGGEAAENKRKAVVIDLNDDFTQSAARLTQLKNNRHVDDIPINDEYWQALKKHNLAYDRFKHGSKA